MPKKCILILLDGIGDRSYEQFEDQTPLQAARTPFLDKLAAGGSNGLYHAALLGQALPSENAHFHMFGYDMKDFPGRGVLEALGAGIELSAKDVAVLSHFACLSESGGSLIVNKRKPEILEDEVAELSHVVKEFETDDVRIRFIRTKGIFGIIVLSGDVAPFITDSDPFMDDKSLIEPVPWAAHRHNMACANTAAALKDYLVWVYRRLAGHPVNQLRIEKGRYPVNGFVTQRAGQLKTVTPFHRQNGLRGISIASGMVYWGLSAYVGMDYRQVNDTGNPGRDLAERLKMARQLLNDGYDFVHVHTKAPDEAAHSKNPDVKKTTIESLDRALDKEMGPVMDDPEVLVIITADHSTPSSGPLIHSGESVPLTFFGRGVRRDRVSRFDEISAAGGALGTVRGRELMYLLLNHLDRAKLQGVMDTPIDQPYWPGDYESFRLE